MPDSICECGGQGQHAEVDCAVADATIRLKMEPNPGGNPSRQTPSVDPNWSFPTANRATDRDDDLADEPTSLLRTAPFAEARLICEKLEAEGIPCVPGRHQTEYEDLQGDLPVNVLVRESDLERAMEVAERPTASVEEVFDEEERFERVVGSWHCPKWIIRGRSTHCRCRKNWRTVSRQAWLGILMFPFVVMLLRRPARGWTAGLGRTR